MTTDEMVDMINGKKPMPSRFQKGVDEIEKVTFRQIIEEK